ncbi:hypothetical protein [Wenjunlia tyrosinilytica]|uniref:Nuclear transport factor 2 family protein n=1 Tax=Wenjunlia tyrosinilytica TaxID=1544741 RepID=A0A917ZLM9_9ACTN|nr:hypothetical protein [Wenjunlia tyrosinilytica]GGO84744.1 hypothetical protein GCM10012280_16920 [Wenjunlia tyrosinilytica]
MSKRRITRKAVVATGVAAVLLPLTAVATAQAAGTQHGAATHTRSAAAAPTASGTPDSALTRINDFYGAYIDAGSEEGGGKLATELRKFYLTKGLQKKLAKWEDKNHADGVLRAQSIPSKWSVTSDGSGAGHTWATVKLTWGGGVVTKIHVQADLATKKISDIK